jgi:glycolate oxidase FAD binding subunit
VSATGVSLDLVRELRAICGDEHVVEADKASVIMASPGSADEVAAIIRLANQHGFTIAPDGGHGDVASSSQADVLLRMHRLAEVEHYDPADLTVGVGAGMTVARLNTIVAGGKLMFACDPAFPELATVGGVLAAAKHGPLRQGFGGVRDFCIGIRFVTGDGRKAKGGGRVVKNVAGYDLMKLLIGSYGTLAVITSASFKLFPAPRQTRTFLAEYATWQEALKFRDQVVRSPLSPMCLEIVSPEARKMMRPEMIDDAWVICVRAAGSDAVLARYHKELGTAITREIDGDGERQMWRALEQFPFAEHTGGPHLYRTVSLFVPPAELGTTLQALQDLSATGVAYVGRAGLGHLLVAVPATEGEGVEPFVSLRDKVPKSLQVVNDWSTLDSRHSMRAVKQALDPENVLRGRELF